jgi:hypothetical protein
LIGIFNEEKYSFEREIETQMIREKIVEIMIICKFFFI